MPGEPDTVKPPARHFTAFYLRFNPVLLEQQEKDAVKPDPRLFPDVFTGRMITRGKNLLLNQKKQCVYHHNG